MTTSAKSGIQIGTGFARFRWVCEAECIGHNVPTLRVTQAGKRRHEVLDAPVGDNLVPICWFDLARQFKVTKRGNRYLEVGRHAAITQATWTMARLTTFQVDHCPVEDIGG